MDPKELDGSRPHSKSCTSQQLKASESNTLFTGLKTPWEDFHRAQAKRLSRIAAEMGVPPDSIQDVLQEVWLDAIKHSELFRGDGTEKRLSKWLGIVVRSKSSNALRRVKRRRIESLDGLPVEPQDGKAVEGLGRLESQEGAQRLTAAMGDLRKDNPLNFRLVCEHILLCRSLPQLATETGFGVHAISCRIDRALKKLRNRLRE